MGGTPLIELYVVYNELDKFLDGKGIKISRNLIGTYITSLEMAGLLDHAAEARRRADRAVGRAGPHAGAALGGLSGAQMAATSAQIYDMARNVMPASSPSNKST